MADRFERELERLISVAVGRGMPVIQIAEEISFAIKEAVKINALAAKDPRDFEERMLARIADNLHRL